MNGITPRTPQQYNIKDMRGRILTSNLFPTLKGRLLYVWNDKCYFEITANPDYTKYNDCEGQIEYLPQTLVMCVEFEED